MHRLVVAALALAVLGGPSAPGARRPPDKPAPGRQEPSAKPPKPAPGKGQGKGRPSPRPAWLERTDGVCRDGLRRRSAVLDSVRRKPSGSARTTLVRILEGTLRVEGTMLTRLDRIEPLKPARAQFADAVALFRARRAEDVALLARLQRRWDASSLERQLSRDRATNARLAKLWAKVGSAGCATYFRAAKAAR